MLLARPPHPSSIGRRNRVPMRPVKVSQGTTAPSNFAPRHCWRLSLFLIAMGTTFLFLSSGQLGFATSAQAKGSEHRIRGRKTTSKTTQATSTTTQATSTTTQDIIARNMRRMQQSGEKIHTVFEQQPMGGTRKRVYYMYKKPPSQSSRGKSETVRRKEMDDFSIEEEAAAYESFPNSNDIPDQIFSESEEEQDSDDDDIAELRGSSGEQPQLQIAFNNTTITYTSGGQRMEETKRAPSAIKSIDRGRRKVSMRQQQNREEEAAERRRQFQYEQDASRFQQGLSKFGVGLVNLAKYHSPLGRRFEKPNAHTVSASGCKCPLTNNTLLYTGAKGNGDCLNRSGVASDCKWNVFVTVNAISPPSC